MARSRSIGAAAIFAVALCAFRAAAYTGDVPTDADAGTDAGAEAGPNTTATLDGGADGFADTGAITDASAPPTYQPVSDSGAVASPSKVADAGSAPPKDTGFVFGIRPSLALPLGNSRHNAATATQPAYDVPLSGVVSYSLIIAVDGGYFFTPKLYLGVYAGYGFASTGNVSSTCSDSNTSCSASQVVFGVRGEYRFRPKEVFDPWAGVSAGYEVLNLTAVDGSGSTVASSADHGFDLGGELGFDVRVKHFWGFGPWASVSAGHYWQSELTIHGWASFGLRLFSLL